MPIEFSSGSGRVHGGSRRGRRGEDRGTTKTIELQGWQRWAALGAILVLFGGLWFFFRDEAVEPSPQKACVEWAKVRHQVRNTGDASPSVESSLRLVKRYAEGSEFEGLAREIARDYDRGIVDEFEKQDLTDACAAVS